MFRWVNRISGLYSPAILTLAHISTRLSSSQHARRPHLLLSAVLRHRCCRAPAARRCRSVSCPQGAQLMQTRRTKSSQFLGTSFCIGFIDSSTHHSCHPAAPHSSILGLKPPFSAKLSHRSISFLLQDRLHGSPPDYLPILMSLSVLIFFTFSFFPTFWLLVPCGIYGHTSKQHFVSYRNCSFSDHMDVCTPYELKT